MNYNYDPQKIRVLPNDGLKLLVSDGSSSNYEINEVPIIDESGAKAHFRLVTPDDSKAILWKTKVGKGLEKWLKSFDEFKDMMIESTLLEIPEGYSLYEHIKEYKNKDTRRDTYLYEKLNFNDYTFIQSGGKYRFRSPNDITAESATVKKKVNKRKQSIIEHKNMPKQTARRSIPFPLKAPDINHIYYEFKPAAKKVHQNPLILSQTQIQHLHRLKLQAHLQVHQNLQLQLDFLAITHLTSSIIKPTNTITTSTSTPSKASSTPASTSKSTTPTTFPIIKFVTKPTSTITTSTPMALPQKHASTITTSTPMAPPQKHSTITPLNPTDTSSIIKLTNIITNSTSTSTPSKASSAQANTSKSTTPTRFPIIKFVTRPASTITTSTPMAPPPKPTSTTAPLNLTATSSVIKPINIITNSTSTSTPSNASSIHANTSKSTTPRFPIIKFVTRPASTITTSTPMAPPPKPTSTTAPLNPTATSSIIKPINIITNSTSTSTPSNASIVRPATTTISTDNKISINSAIPFTTTNVTQTYSTTLIQSNYKPITSNKISTRNSIGTSIPVSTLAQPSLESQSLLSSSLNYTQAQTQFTNSSFETQASSNLISMPMFIDSKMHSKFISSAIDTTPPIVNASENKKNVITTHRKNRQRHSEKIPLIVISPTLDFLSDNNTDISDLEID
nr:476_t:CDS:2 [Entrophospora candida]